jgi:hypothetical protein
MGNRNSIHRCVPHRLLHSCSQQPIHLTGPECLDSNTIAYQECRCAQPGQFITNRNTSPCSNAQTDTYTHTDTIDTSVYLNSYDKYDTGLGTHNSVGCENCRWRPDLAECHSSEISTEQSHQRCFSEQPDRMALQPSGRDRHSRHFHLAHY